MANTDLCERARRYYAAFLDGDRSVLESSMADDFTFTSPYDDHIDREAFFERCWPNHRMQRAIRLDKVTAAGRDVFVLYTCQLQSGVTFRNMECLSFDPTHRLRAVEVFFGDPPHGVDRDDYARFIDIGRRAWREQRAETSVEEGGDRHPHATRH